MDLRNQREFLAEIEQLVEQLLVCTEGLRRQVSGPIRRESVAHCFRCLHSIKGIAVSAGFDAIAELAHHTETLLAATRAGRITIDDQLIDTLEDAADAISENLGTVAAGASEPLPQNVLRKRIELAALANRLDTETFLFNLRQEIADAFNEREKQQIIEAIREDARLYVIGAGFDVAVFDSEFQELRTTLTKHGEVIATLPAVDSSRPERVGFRIVYSSDLEAQDLKQLVASSEIVVTELSRPPATDDETGGRETPTGSGGGQQPTAASFVRVELTELDRLISSSHEIYGQTIEALDLLAKILPADSRAELKNLAAQIRESLLRLEQQEIELRTVSLDSVMQRALRAGRVAARLAGKEIKFRVEGSDLRLDKVLCDAIANPLLHLVRNAVDHGIEPQAERVRAGKKPSGSIRIVAGIDRGRARVVVTDDGRGIDPQFVSQTAVDLGLIEPDFLLDIEQSLRMIFRPGFSTTRAVSSVSGRGVGLDVVERAIEQVGGALRVHTKPGQGTNFEIRLPPAFGVLRALVIVSCGSYYCLDASQVVAHAEIDGTEIRRTSSGEVLSWQGEILPLISLRRVLGQQRQERKGGSQVIICQVAPEESGENSRTLQRAFVVDAIESVQEVLVRSLGRHAARWIAVLGAAELRNGRAALVLDLPALVAK